MAPIQTAALPLIEPARGNSLTNALIFRALVIALVPVIEIVPEIVPVETLVDRTNIVVAATVPEVGVKLTVLESPEAATVEISNPVGAVKLIFEVK